MSASQHRRPVAKNASNGNILGGETVSAKPGEKRMMKKLARRFSVRRTAEPLTVPTLTSKQQFGTSPFANMDFSWGEVPLKLKPTKIKEQLGSCKMKLPNKMETNVNLQKSETVNPPNPKSETFGVNPVVIGNTRSTAVNQKVMKKVGSRNRMLPVSIHPTSSRSRASSKVIKTERERGMPLSRTVSKNQYQTQSQPNVLSYNHSNQRLGNSNMASIDINEHDGASTPMSKDTEASRKREGSTSSHHEREPFKFSYSAFEAMGCDMKGEDLILIREDLALFAVFDGHINKRTAEFCEDYVPKCLLRKLEEENYMGASELKATRSKDIPCIWEIESHARAREMMIEVFNETHEACRDKVDQSGSTAVMVWFYRLLPDEVDIDHDNDDKGHEDADIYMISANAGDARAILARSIPAVKQHHLESFEDAGFDENNLTNTRTNSIVSPSSARKALKNMTSAMSILRRRKSKKMPKRGSRNLATSPDELSALQKISSQESLPVGSMYSNDSVNVSGSRAEAVRLSVDHKATVPSEIRRVEAAGGEICNGYLEYQLGVTRGVGDHDFEPAFIPLPHVSSPITIRVGDGVANLNTVDESRRNLFIILSSDGIFEKIVDEDAVDFLFDHISKAGILGASMALGQYALDKDAPDDLSCLVLSLDIRDHFKGST